MGIHDWHSSLIDWTNRRRVWRIIQSIATTWQPITSMIGPMNDQSLPGTAIRQLLAERLRAPQYYTDAFTYKHIILYICVCVCVLVCEERNCRAIFSRSCKAQIIVGSAWAKSTQSPDTIAIINEPKTTVQSVGWSVHQNYVGVSD